MNPSYPQLPFTPFIVPPVLNPFFKNQSWKINFVDPTLVPFFTPQTLSSLKLFVGNRADGFTEVVPEQLYSSLRYQVKQSLPFLLFGNQTNSILSKLEVVDPLFPKKQIVRSDGKSVIKGTGVTALVRDGNYVKGQTKIQFTDCSFHHENKKWAFRISFYKSDLCNPLLVLISSPFFVKARKPKSETKKKRKMESPMQPISLKKKKLEKKSDLEEVKRAIDGLVISIMHLNQEEREQAQRYFNERLNEKLLLRTSLEELVESEAFDFLDLLNAE